MAQEISVSQRRPAPAAVPAVSAIPLGRRRAPRPIARLRLISGPGGIKLFALAADEIAVGRGSDNSVAVVEPTLSKHHALLLRSGRTYQLCDLDSTNGSRVNGVRVTDAVLRSGDVVELGTVRFRFEIAAPREARRWLWIVGAVCALAVVWAGTASLITRRPVAGAVTTDPLYRALNAAEARGDDAAVLQQAGQLAAKYPIDSGAQFILGVAHGRVGNFAAAVAAFQRTVLLQPAAADAWSNLGWAHGRLANWTAAAAAYRRAVALNPTDATAWAGLVRACFKLQHFEEASYAAGELKRLAPAKANALADELERAQH